MAGSTGIVTRLVLGLGANLTAAAALAQSTAGDGMAAAGADRGAALFRPACGFCHGAEGGGGQGPNLTTSPFFTTDDRGRSLGEFLKTGRPGAGMPAFPAMAQPDVAALHAFIRGRAASSADARGDVASVHPRRQRSRGPRLLRRRRRLHRLSFRHRRPQGRRRPLQSPDPAGPHHQPPGCRRRPRRTRRCCACGEGQGDLGQGQGGLGQLVQVNDFFVTLIDAKGDRRTIARKGPTPRVQIDDPVEAHRKMMLNWTDQNMWNVTAYLAEREMIRLLQRRAPWLLAAACLLATGAQAQAFLDRDHRQAAGR